jgi:formylglycine-generating enzyme required for sulfatase activity
MKNLLRLVSVALVFLATSSAAQVSNVEGIEPMDGVAIPKVQISQPQSVKPGAVFKDCDDCPEMVVIPAGSFLMGSPPDPEPDPFSNAKPEKFGKDNEKPQHRVDIQSFAIGKYEVTQEQWYAVMGNNPSFNKGRKLPVENVSWDDAQLFVQKLSQKTGKKYRLPSEAEWEYAARAGSTTTYPWGNSESELHVHAWFNAIAYAPNPVGLKKPNQFGLHDMIGNVWEWTQDCWNENYKNAPTDGSAWISGNCSFPVLRGGSWVDFPKVLRTANRHISIHANRGNGLGFRVALLALSAGVASAENKTETLPSGVKIEHLKEGGGSSPKAADTVVAHYRGTLPDGKEFDSSYKRGEPIAFPLTRVIPCWSEGMQKIKVGGKARLTCPPATAYGDEGVRGVIPPKTVLQFEVELVSIKK